MKLNKDICEKLENISKELTLQCDMKIPSTDAEFLSLVEIAKSNKTRLDEVKVIKDGILKPLKESIKKVNTLFAKYEDKIEYFQEIIKSTLKNVKVKESKGEEVGYLIPKIKGFYYRTKIKVEIQNMHLVPREYLKQVVDEKKVIEAFEKGEIVPGTKVFADYAPVLRG